jgi:parallel beta-helix repeat protein
MTRRAWKASARWAALGVLLGLGAAVGPAEAVTLIPNCPYTIMQPGVYVLASDLTCPGPAITITADNVVLNLNGNTLTSDGGGGAGVLVEGIDANPTLEGLRVENGTVTGFQDGVYVEDAPGARVARVTARDNSSAGIAVYDSPGARIEDNTVTDGGDDGIQTENCDGCRIAGNRANGNGDEGIDFFSNSADGITGARIEGNTASGNGGEGIGLTNNVDGNLVRGNTANGNGEEGIHLSPSSGGATGNRLEGNTATGNGTNGGGDPDLFDGNLPACVNTWRGNKFVTDNEQGAAAGPGAGCIQ